MLRHENRLTEKTHFEKVRQNGKFASTPFFSVSFLDRKDKEPSRFGFIVSKKLSTKSNVRNKVKRILRELVRKNLKSVKAGFDFVIIAKSGILTQSNATIESKLKEFIC